MLDQFHRADGHRDARRVAEVAARRGDVEPVVGGQFLGDEARYRWFKVQWTEKGQATAGVSTCPERKSNYIVTMLTKIVPIGNSRGIRIPKAMLEHCGFGEEVELLAKKGALILRPVNIPRANWAAAFQGMATAKDDFLVHEDKSTATQFETEEWTW